MKNLIRTAIILTILSGLTSCEYDNYDEPGSVITGRFVYDGHEVGVKNNLDALRLYEEGWQNFDPINIPVKHTGEFETIQFDGDYKLYIIPGSGPWQDIPDTLNFQLRGKENLDIEVTPFFWLENVKINASGNELNATADLKHVVESKNLQFVTLLIGKTMLVDNQFKLKEQRLPAGQIPDMSGPISIDMNLDNIEQKTIFARIGVKAKGNPQLVFSQVQKIEL